MSKLINIEGENNGKIAKLMNKTLSSVNCKVNRRMKKLQILRNSHSNSVHTESEFNSNSIVHSDHLTEEEKNFKEQE